MKINLIDSLKTLRKKQAEEILALNRVRTPLKRTTIFPQELLTNPVFRPQRMTPVESFKTFVERIIPKMQETVESNFLKAHFQRIASEDLKNSILQAYERRRINLEVNKRPPTDITDPGDLHGLGLKPPENIQSPTPITNQTQKDVGLYNVFPVEDFGKVFRNKGFGDYSKVELVYTEKFGIMCVEEAVRVTEQLQSLTPIGKANISVKTLLPDGESTEKLREKLKEAKIYKAIYHLLSVSLVNALALVRKDLFAQRLFNNPAVFDFIISVILEELPKKTLIPLLDNKSSRDKIMSQILLQFVEKADKLQSNSQKIAQLIAPIKSLAIDLPENKGKYTIDLLQYSKESPSQPAVLGELAPNFRGFNSGVLYYGEKGTGKSGALLYLAMWAHKSNWILVNVPSCFDWTQNNKYAAFRHNATGLFMQYEMGKEFLEDFKSANEHLIKDITVNLDIYGKINVSGVHENDADTKPNIYYPDRKTYWNDHEQFLYPDEKKAVEDQDKFFETQRLSLLLPSPKTLLDIVNYGIANEKLSICAIGELLEQLYNIETHNVMVLVDEYNYMFRPSVIASFRYANDKNLQSKVPPYHIALCRLFMNLDGHKIKNGFKAVASSNKRFIRHTFNPDKILLPPGYSCEMKGLCLDDYRNMMKYYEQNKLWFPPDHEQEAYEQFWMENQGNWHETIKVMTHFMRV